MENNTKTPLVVGLVVIVAVILGFVFWNMNGTDDETANNASTSQQQAESDATEMEEAPKDIVETAVATQSLSTLVAAVQAADLVDALKADGPLTVFAPDNAAFEKLPEGTLTDLLKPENKETLAGILTYHVVSGKVLSSDLSNGQVVTTLNGKTLTVEITDGKVYLVDATGAKSMVSSADIETSNGVVHVIDSVVLPQ